MKKLVICLILVFPFFAISQTREFKVNDEVNYFDGLNWVESVILEVKGNSYLIYANREKTSKVWAKKDDLEFLYGEVETITDFTVESTMTYTLPTYHVGDSVYYGQVLSKIVELNNETVTITTDSLGQVKTVVEEEDITLYSSEHEVNYRYVDKTKKKRYAVGLKVQYENNGMIELGKIDKISSEKKLFVNNKWISYKDAQLID